MGRLASWIRRLAHLPERRSTGKLNTYYFGWALREVSGDAKHPKHPEDPRRDDRSAG